MAHSMVCLGDCSMEAWKKLSILLPLDGVSYICQLDPFGWMYSWPLNNVAVRNPDTLHNQKFVYKFIVGTPYLWFSICGLNQPQIM